MSLWAPADVEALVASGLAPDVLQGLIDREEDWLATDLRFGIGQLVDARTQTVWRHGSQPILLARPTLAVSVVDNGVARTDVALLGGIRVAPHGLWVGPLVEITYTPSDLARVKRILLELIRIAVSDSPYRQEATEGHSYSRPLEVETMRGRLALTLHPALRAGASVRIGPQ
jgi:hypothetical protein